MTEPITFSPRKPPEHMSHSQASSLLTCGEQYRLIRILGVPDPSGWALTGGKALHRATEEYDRALVIETESRWLSASGGTMDPSSKAPNDSTSGGESSRGRGEREVAPAKTGEIVENFEADIRAAAHDAARAVLEFGAEAAQPHLDALVSLTLRDELWQLQANDLKRADGVPTRRASRGQLKEADGSTLDEMFPDLRAAGRASKDWPGKQNGLWWSHHLPAFMRGWVDFREANEYELAFANGKPAVELDVSAVLGDISIKAYLDRVMLHPAGKAPMVLDLKTSQSEPSDPEQLGLYAALLEARGMPRPRWGAYWMARTGKLGTVHDLSKYTAEFFNWKFGVLKRHRDAGEFIANTKSPFCSSCPVRDFCYAVNGRKADQVPKPWEQNSNASRSIEESH